MTAKSDVFVDQSSATLEKPIDFWDSHIVSKEEIDAEIERLADLPFPEHGRRQSIIKHPRATAPGNGLAPGTRVTLSVLKPGEKTRAFRHNATEVNFCIQGSGHTLVAGRKIDFSQYDIWNHPSFTPYWHFNDSKELQVRLTYSNAALLEMMNIYVAEENPAEPSLDGAHATEEVEVDPRKTNPFGMIPLGDEGAQLMPYEVLVAPEPVEDKPLHFPWSFVKPNLDRLEALGQEYLGRRLYMMYNPATGRTNGITPSFFATITLRPAQIVDRPHRHTSAAINYIMTGYGRSVVEKKKMEWKAGDLILTAPGWAIHNHASKDVPVYELTVQDQPLNIAMESLLWQEDLRHPPKLLGAQEGFATNRGKVASAKPLAAAQSAGAAD